VIKIWNSPVQQQQQQPSTPGPTTAAPPPPGKQKKKLDLKEVFNTDDDEDSNLGSGKKRKLVPLGAYSLELLDCLTIGTADHIHSHWEPISPNSCMLKQPVE
jgi:hypothetical protein